MFTIAALLGPSADKDSAPALRLIGAAPLAALMAAARVELGRERACSCSADAPNSAPGRRFGREGKAPLAQKFCELARERGVIARLAFPDHER